MDNPGENSTSYQTVLTTVEGSLSSANVVGVLNTAVSGAVVLVLLWWSIRKSVGIVKRAFMRGKLRL